MLSTIITAWLIATSKLNTINHRVNKISPASHYKLTHISKKEPEKMRGIKVRYMIGYVASRSGSTCARNIRNHRGSSGAIYWIIYKESSFNPKCRDPRSSAYGLAGFLNQQWKDQHVQKTSDPVKQIEAMYKYIDMRYKGDPWRAYSFWRKHGWY